MYCNLNASRYNVSLYTDVPKLPNVSPFQCPRDQRPIAIYEQALMRWSTPCKKLQLHKSRVELMLGFVTASCNLRAGGSEIEVPDTASSRKRTFENTVSTTRYFQLIFCDCSGAAVTASEYRLGTVCLVLIPIIPTDEMGERQSVSHTPCQRCPSTSTVLADKFIGEILLLIGHSKPCSKINRDIISMQDTRPPYMCTKCASFLAWAFPNLLP